MSPAHFVLVCYMVRRIGEYDCPSCPTAERSLSALFHVHGSWPHAPDMEDCCEADGCGVSWGYRDS